MVRASIVLACADGVLNKDVAKQLRVTEATVCKWRKRFIERGLEGLKDERRPGRWPHVTSKIVDSLVARALAPPPSGAARWSTRQLAKEIGASVASVNAILRKLGMRLDHLESMKPSLHPETFAEVAHDIVGLYVGTSNRLMVFCVKDSGPEVVGDPSRHRRRQRFPRPRPWKIDPTMISVFSILDATVGKAADNGLRENIGEFRAFLVDIDNAVPRGFTIHVTFDNMATFLIPTVRRWFNDHPKWRAHFLPNKGFWAPTVDLFFRTVFCQRNGKAIKFQPDFEQSVLAYIGSRNGAPGPFKWVRAVDPSLRVDPTFTSPRRRSAHKRARDGNNRHGAQPDESTRLSS